MAFAWRWKQKQCDHSSCGIGIFLFLSVCLLFDNLQPSQSFPMISKGEAGPSPQAHESQNTRRKHARQLLQTTQESFLFSECDCEGWICNPGFFQEFNLEANCWGCVPCPTKCATGSFLGGPCNPFSSPCKACTVCSEEQIEAEPCGEDTNTVCYECSQCNLLANSTSHSEICRAVQVIGPRGINSTNMTNTTVTKSSNTTNMTLAPTPTPIPVDPEIELFCRFCPQLPPLSAYTGQFDDSSGRCGFSCAPPLFLTNSGECSCGEGFLNETAQKCQACRECPQGHLRECNATADAVCFPCLNPLPPLCWYNGTFNASTGICDTACEETDCRECSPGTLRPEGANCTIPCENCPTMLPANTEWTAGCEYVCQDRFYFARGECNACTECTLGQYLNAPCTPTEDTDCRDCPNQVLPALAQYSGVYDRGQLKCSIVCLGQVPLTSDGEACRCPSGHFVNGSLLCAPCTVCGAGEFQDAACSLQADAVCLACSTCAAGTYTNSNCNLAADTDCLPCSTCPAGTFPTAACSTVADTQCKTCTTCGDEEYATVSCRSTVMGGDTDCANCTKCGVGSYAGRVCNETADTVCSVCNNTRPDGAAWTGGAEDGECVWECEGLFARADVNGTETCEGCKAGNFKDGALCVPCTQCTAVGEFQASPCSAAADAICTGCPRKPDEADFALLPADSCRWLCRAGWFRDGDNCSNCSGAPPNAAYTGVYTDDVGDCEWVCRGGYVEAAGRCLCASGWFNPAEGVCQQCASCDPATQIPLQSCNATHPGWCRPCQAKPEHSSYTGEWDEAREACVWECDAGWSADGGVAGSVASNVSACFECGGCDLGSFISRECSAETQPQCAPCPNLLPSDAFWTGEYTPATACGWECRPFSSFLLANRACECLDGYRRDANRSCIECLLCPQGLKEERKCNDVNDTVCRVCPNQPAANASFDRGVNATTGDCTWQCNPGWTYYRRNMTIFPTLTQQVTTSAAVTTMPTTTTTAATTPATTTAPGGNDTNTTNLNTSVAAVATTSLSVATTTPVREEDPGPQGVVVWTNGCELCTVCVPGSYEQRPCTPLADTLCPPCPNGVPPGAHYLLTLDSRGFCEYRCPDGQDCNCPAGQWWDDAGLGECRECTECAHGTWQSSECVVWADTVCLPCTNTPPTHEVFIGGLDAETGECRTDCAPGWQRYDTSLPLNESGTPSPFLANATLNSTGDPHNGTAVTTAPPATTPPSAMAGEEGVNATLPPCMCLASKIEGPDGSCEFCSQCQPGSLLTTPCNASGNRDTECRTCPNGKPAGSVWEPGVNGTFLNAAGDCVWKCRPGLTPVQDRGETICLCLGTPASCGYCPVLPGNATVIGSWCAGFQYLFDGSCQPKDFTALRLLLLFTFPAWTPEGFLAQQDPFASSVAAALAARVSQVQVDVDTVTALRRASPLRVGARLSGVPIESVLRMLAAPDELAALLAAQGLPRPTSIMVGESSAIDLNAPVEVNTTPPPAVFLVEEPTVATSMALIIGLGCGFAVLFVLAGLGYLVVLSRRAAANAKEALEAKYAEAEERRAEKKKKHAEATQGEEAKSSGLLGFVRKKKK